MSYDVAVGGESFNYTSNMRPFFRQFGVDPKQWAGRHRHVVASEIAKALEQIATIEPSVLRAGYDSPNGWGSVETAVEFLREVRAACLYEPPEWVEVSW